MRWYIEVWFRDYHDEERVDPVPISDNEGVARAACERARADWNAGGVVGVRGSELHDWHTFPADAVLEIRLASFEDLVG